MISFHLRILFPEIQPRLASLLKKGYKVGRNIENYGFPTKCPTPFLLLLTWCLWLGFLLPSSCRWCSSPTRWASLKENCDRKFSSLRWRTSWPRCSFLCRYNAASISFISVAIYMQTYYLCLSFRYLWRLVLVSTGNPSWECGITCVTR